MSTRTHAATRILKSQCVGLLEHTSRPTPSSYQAEEFKVHCKITSIILFSKKVLPESWQPWLQPRTNSPRLGGWAVVGLIWGWLMVRYQNGSGKGRFFLVLQVQHFALICSLVKTLDSYRSIYFDSRIFQLTLLQDIQDQPTNLYLSELFPCQNLNSCGIRLLNDDGVYRDLLNPLFSLVCQNRQAYLKGCNAITHQRLSGPSLWISKRRGEGCDPFLLCPQPIS